MGRVERLLYGFRDACTEQSGTRKLLIIGMLILLLAVIIRSGTGMYSNYEQSINNQIEIRLSELEQMNRLVLDEQRYRDEHSALTLFEKEHVDSGLILTGRSTMAEVRFQNLISDLADNAGLNVQSLKVLPRTNTGPVTCLTIAINCLGDIEAIKNFLMETSNNDKFIFVDQMEVRRTSSTERKDFNFSAQLIAWIR